MIREVLCYLIFALPFVNINLATYLKNCESSRCHYNIRAIFKWCWLGRKIYILFVLEIDTDWFPNSSAHVTNKNIDQFQFRSILIQPTDETQKCFIMEIRYFALANNKNQSNIEKNIKRKHLRACIFCNICNTLLELS